MKKDTNGLPVIPERGFEFDGSASLLHNIQADYNFYRSMGYSEEAAKKVIKDIYGVTL